MRNQEQMITKQSFLLWFNRNRLEMVYGNPILAEKMEWFLKKIDEQESYALYKNWLELIQVYLMEEAEGTASVRPQALRELKQLIQLYSFHTFIEEIKPELKEIIQSMDLKTLYEQPLFRCIDDLQGDAATLRRLVEESEHIKEEYAHTHQLLPVSFEFLVTYFQTLYDHFIEFEKKAT